MNDVFDFSMENSLKLTKEILERQTRSRLKNFDDVAQSYLRNKRSLLRAINPDNDSGRVVFKVTSFNAEACCRDINETICNNLWSTIASCSLRQIDGYFVCEEDVRTGLLSPENRMVSINDDKGKPLAKPGMKLTKAIQIAIKKSVGNKLSDTTIAANITLIGEILARHKIEMNFCISANILDIILMSSHSTFTSCHRLGGEFCAGPQQYLQDGHTAIAYGWTHWGREDLSGVKLPYKRWRQTIHFNLKDKCACFVRQYSDIGFLEEATHVNIREQAARILARHAKLPSEETDWYKSEKITSPMVEIDEDGIQLAYIDDPGKHNGSYKIRLSTGLYRKMYLNGMTKCMKCGNEITSSGYHLCHVCVGRKDANCSCCNKYAPEEGSVFLNSRLFCAECAFANLCVCEKCDTQCAKNDTMLADGKTICQACHRANYYSCSSCYSIHRIDSEKIIVKSGKRVCRSCADLGYTQCGDCSLLVVNRAISHLDDGTKICSTCNTNRVAREAAERERDQRNVMAAVESGAISAASAVEFVVGNSNDAVSNETHTVEVQPEEMPF